MRNVVTLGVLCLHVPIASASEPPEVDPDTRAFAEYVSDVSRLNGMYRGVADYCKQFAPALILEQTDAIWRNHNGQYIDAVDVAIERYASAKVEPARKAEAIQQLKANAQAWFQAAHDKSKVLDQLQNADSKDFACSKMLGTMASDSFALKKMFPAVDEYWSNNLKP